MGETREQKLRARDAKLCGIAAGLGCISTLEVLRRAAEIGAEEEREACAELVSRWYLATSTGWKTGDQVRSEIAEAIRARGKG